MPQVDLKLISLADYERAAASVLDPASHSYLAGGATDETTMRDNVAAWGRFAIRPSRCQYPKTADTALGSALVLCTAALPCKGCPQAPG